MFSCLRLVAEMEWDSDCQVELSLHGARVGVSNVKFRANVVVELYHLLYDRPLMDGVRIYFVTPPELDLQMIGGVGGILNATWNTPYYIPIVRPLVAKISVALHGSNGSFGRVELDVKELMEQEKLAYHFDSEVVSSSRRSSRLFEFGETSRAPRLRVSFQLWVVGSSRGSESRPLTPNSSSPRMGESYSATHGTKKPSRPGLCFCVE